LTGWLGDERAQLAAEKILDAAAELFVEKGIAGVGMGEIARAAGCSRATLYRYFADRGQLHVAFVHREARRVHEMVAKDLRGVKDPAERVITTVLSSLREVRSAPTLAAWFREGDAGISADLAQSSGVIEALGMSVVEDAAAARWLVRVIVSLLTVPGRDEADERAMVERFVAPVVPAGSHVTRG
jgi:AcrR family transcriptional regulator